MKSYDYESDDELIERNNKSDKSDHCDPLFIVIFTLLFFCTSLADLSYSYINIDPCQNKEDFTLSLDLNIWLRVSGIYGIFYYIAVLIIYLNIRPYSTNRIRDNSEYFKNLYFTYRITIIFFSVIGVTWSTFGLYSFIHYFWGVCDSYAILIYMWTRPIIGIGCYLMMIVMTPYYLLPQI